MTQSEINAKETVLAFIGALNEEDFNGAKQYVHEDLSFIGVLGSRDGAAAYFSDMEKMKIKYRIGKVFAAGADVCILCDFILGEVTVFGCGWYQVKDDKISTIRVVFDPRPVLAGAGK